MNTTQLECFTTAANFLNFSRAAEHLSITQPAVSHQINTLEDELGVKLFHRTSKSVRLTQEGYLFMEYASEILKLSQLSKVRLKESNQAMPARIVIGCRSATELRFLRPALKKLRHQYPQWLPVLRLIPSDSLENLLTEGNIHVMFSFEESAPKKTRYFHLADCPAVCVCSQEHPLAGYQQLTVEQLKTGGRIAICRPPICPPALFTIQSQAVGDRAPGEILFCDNHEVVCTLAEVGYAFAVLADFPHARLPELRYIPLPEFEPLSFGAVYLPGERGGVLQEFLNMLAESVENWDSQEDN